MVKSEIRLKYACMHDAATSEMVMEAYDLEPIFKKYGVIK